MSDKKLSEEIEDLQLGYGADDADYLVRDSLAAKARDLEERVTECERVRDEWRKEAKELLAAGQDAIVQRDKATARAEAAEAEVATANKWVIQLTEIRTGLLNENDALRAEVARLREDAEGHWSDYASASVRGLEKERDALRAKLEKLRAKADKLLSWPEYTNPTAHKVALAFQRILDGKGSDEA